MSTNRRDFFARVTTVSAGIAATVKSLAAQSKSPQQTEGDHVQHGQSVPQNVTAKAATEQTSTAPAEPFMSVVVPDLPKLPYKLVDGVKEFKLAAEVVNTAFMPGRPVAAWGYNGSVPGPTIEVQEGDRVRIIFENNLPEPTTPHWHGIELPIEMDGVPGITQDPVMPGERFTYEFTLHQNGTFFYHSHMPMQEMMGMIGFFIIHPKQSHEPKVDRDFGIILQEWAILPNNNVPNTLAMEFNWLTMNGKVGPAITPMLVKPGERVRIRLVNLGMDHHPIHLHGHQFVVTGSEGGRQPETTWAPGNTVIVGVAQARDVEFVAKYEGDWMLHCHMPHHNMNQMSSMVGPVMRIGNGLQTGAGMQEGMGIIRQGNALSEELGPSLGRGLGVSADRERLTSNSIGGVVPDVLTEQQPASAGGHDGHDGQAKEDPLTTMYPKDDPEKKKIAGYPQDMWMVMDEMFKNKPENFGLRRGWTAGMMGMMTLVRVLPPEKYSQIMSLLGQKEQQTSEEKKPAEHVFSGKVEAVSGSTGKLTVNHGAIEGWMGAMTMPYAVDKPESLNTVKVGDQIKATVYDGDYTLHDVRVVKDSNK